MGKVLHTKWGKAKIFQGRYMITSRKEGNHNKLLHRLIWEDFYGCEVPKGYHIHHRDHNPLNNCILNLQLMCESEHHKLHMVGENNPNYNENISEEIRIKMSKSRNTTGFYNVSKYKCKKCKQGFIWLYRYSENGKRKSISSVDLKELEAKVKSKGLIWKKLWG